MLDRGIPLYVRNLIDGLKEEGCLVSVVRAPSLCRQTAAKEASCGWRKRAALYSDERSFGHFGGAACRSGRARVGDARIAG